MLLSTKVVNKNTPWSALLKPRVGTVVTVSGVSYFNISGMNAAVTDTNNWLSLGGGTGSKIIDKTAGNISGSDPNFYINLGGDAMPAFPASVRVYVTLTGLDADWLPVPGDNYNPVTKVLGGMNDPGAFASQKVKIIVL